jgi:Phage capsid family
MLQIERGLPPFPLVPEDINGRPSDHVVRALLAAALNYFDTAKPGSEKVARRLWPDDPATPIVLRSATAPADTTTSGWASQLAATAVSDLVMTLGPTAAAGELFRRAIALQFGTSAAITAPGIVSAATDAAWVAQGAPMPVRELDIGAGATLTPKTMRVGFVVTRELLEHSIPNAEQLIRAVTTESIGVALDSAVLDASAASSTRPAGLRNGVSVTTASAATPASEAMDEDLSTLASIVALVGGLNLAFVASPAQALRIALRAGPDFNSRFPVLASGQLDPGMVMCVALNALVSAIDPAVRFDLTRESTIHLEDTSPLAISSVASPNTVAAPTRSLWQTDCVGFRLRLEASWGLRTSGAVAWTEDVTW